MIRHPAWWIAPLLVLTACRDSTTAAGAQPPSQGASATTADSMVTLSNPCVSGATAQAEKADPVPAGRGIQAGMDWLASRWQDSSCYALHAPVSHRPRSHGDRPGRRTRPSLPRPTTPHLTRV